MYRHTHTHAPTHTCTDTHRDTHTHTRKAGSPIPRHPHPAQLPAGSPWVSTLATDGLGSNHRAFPGESAFCSLKLWMV